MASFKLEVVKDISDQCEVDVTNQSVVASNRSTKRSEWRTRMSNKTNYLTTAWNDLYNIMSEYQAELISKDESEALYDSTNDLDSLRGKLVEKDDALRERDAEIEDLRAQLDDYRQKYEQLRTDMSVKEELLTNYEDDLMTKEGALVLANSKTIKLATQLQALETKAAAATDEPPRKAARIAVSDSGKLITAKTPSGNTRAASNGARTPSHTVKSPVTPVLKTSMTMTRRRTQKLQQVQQTPAVCMDTTEVGHEAQANDVSMDEGAYMAGAWSGNTTGDETTQPSTSQDLSDTKEGLWITNMSSASDASPQLQTPSKLKRVKIKAGPRLRHKCQSCGKRFATSALRNRHIRVEGHGTESRTCTICSKILSSVGARQRHESEYHSSGTIPCGICDRLFKGTADADAHRQRHTLREYPCDDCRYKFICKRHLDRHIEENHAPGSLTSSNKLENKCDVCLKFFRTEEAVHAHVKLTHGIKMGDGSETTFLCECCGQLLNTLAEKKEHMREVHGEGVKLDCNVCGHVFKKMEDLQAHVKRHDSDKKFPCSSCKKVFICRKHLERHIHEGHADLVMCPDCTTCFPNVDLMREHRNKEHQPAYACRCGKLLRRKRSLLRHVETCRSLGTSARDQIQYYCPQCRSLVPDEVHDCKEDTAQYFEVIEKSGNVEERVVYQILHQPAAEVTLEKQGDV